MRRALLVAAVIASSLVPGALSAHAEQRATTCGLTGKAAFKGNGLTIVPGTYGFVFRGKLADCESTGAIKSGAVKAKGTADAGCVNGAAQGKALVKWNTGKKSVIAFSTTDIGASVTLEGEVTKSSEPALNKGDAIVGQLAFEADATKCVEGLKSANFFGQIAGGSPY